MLKRPLVLKLFILYLLLDPLLRSVFITIESEFSFSEVLVKSLTQKPTDFFNYWVLFPLSGVLLWFTNIYSLLFFIFTQIYSIYFHINYESFSWPYLSVGPSISAFLLLATNFLIVVYVLTPSVFRIFKDKNLRHWERGSRFFIDTPCVVALDERMIKGNLKNISFSGALIKLEEALAVGSKIKIDFEVLEKSYVWKAKIVRFADKPEKHIYGIKFKFPSYFSKLKFKTILMMIQLRKLYVRQR